MEYTQESKLRLPELVGGRVNVGRAERLVSVAGGVALGVLALRRKGLPGALLGAVGSILLHRGATGHCMVYGALDIDTAERGAAAVDGEEAPSSVTASITINRNSHDLYHFWRDFRNAPRFMDRVVGVEILDDERSRWTAAGPMGRTWEWESQVTDDVHGELIAWESLPGADLPNRGWVQFVDVDGGRAEVRYFLEFDPPAGVVGQAIADAFSQVPKELVRDDLRRFRALMESEAAPTPGGDADAEEGDDGDANR